MTHYKPAELLLLLLLLVLLVAVLELQRELT